MNIKSIIANGLPEELENIQFGQVIIFSSPEEGMSEKNIRISQYTHSVVKHLKQNCNIQVPAPAVFVVPTENPDLWDYICCKKVMNRRTIVEIADLGCITEMLYDFWGLDYSTTLKPVIGDRYLAYHFSLADYPPARICLPPAKRIHAAASSDCAITEVGESGTDYDSMSIGFISVKEVSQEEINKKIQKILWEAYLNDVEVDYEQIQAEFEEEKKKEYRLELDIEQNPLNQSNTILAHKFFNRCDICLVDNNDVKHVVKLEPQEKMVYLTFMCYNEGEGFQLGDFDYPKGKNKLEFERIYKQISAKINGRQDAKSGVDRKMINEIRSRIRRKINNITMNQDFVQRFSIEGEMDGLFRVAATRQEHISIIRNEFELA